MENIDQPNPSEDPKQHQQQVMITPSSSDDDDDHHSSKVVAVRSYDCIFCKRGFSNAQALGGHMNIHRKQKAMVKQSSSSSSSAVKYGDEDRHKTMQWPRINLGGGDATDDHDTATQQFQSMPLFVSKSTSIHQGQDKTNTTIACEVFDKDSPSAGLDLELRLGPDPSLPPPPLDHHRDESTTGTRKFF